MIFKNFLNKIIKNLYPNFMNIKIYLIIRVNYQNLIKFQNYLIIKLNNVLDNLIHFYSKNHL